MECCHDANNLLAETKVVGIKTVGSYPLVEKRPECELVGWRCKKCSAHHAQKMGIFFNPQPH